MNKMMVIIFLAVSSNALAAAGDCNNAIAKVAQAAAQIGSISGIKEFVKSIDPKSDLDVTKELDAASTLLAQAVAETSKKCTDK